MKVLIVGSVGVRDQVTIEKAVRASGFAPARVVTLGKSGAGRVAEQWAARRGMRTRVLKQKERLAGPTDALKFADALLAIWDGECKVTQAYIHAARVLKLRVHVEPVESKYVAMYGKIAEAMKANPGISSGELSERFGCQGHALRIAAEIAGVRHDMHVGGYIAE